MKQIILAVILLAAIGGGIYYLLQKKKQNNTFSFRQEQILGKWKMDSLATKNDSSALLVALIGTLDSNFMNYDYDFRKEGIVVKYLKDSSQKDTARYEMTKNNQIVWKEPGNPTGDSLVVNVLNKDSLVLRTKDSITFYFKKVK